MSPELFVGIDVGTTMTKAAVVGRDGAEISWGKVPTPWHALSSGAEARPEDLLGAALRAAGEALDAAPDGRVVGLGVTSMAETIALLGKDGRPVAPCIAWHDTRGDQEAAELARTFGASAFSERTGLVASHICSLVKLAHLSRHRSPAAARAMSVADWVVSSLGGAQASEASLASRTGALCLAGRSWWAEGLEWAGAPADLFPPVVQAGERLGSVTAAAIAAALATAGTTGPVALGRLGGAALTTAGHDHLCVAAGTGAIGPGQILDSVGTAEAFVRAVAPMDSAAVGRAVRAGVSVGWHTVPGSYALLGGQSLGLLLDRVLRLLGLAEPDVAALDQAAQAVATGSLRVVQENRYAEPAIVGIDAGASPAVLWRAALDHLSAGAARNLHAMETIAGPAEELVLSGGWSHCDGLRRRRHALLPSSHWPAVTEAGARGAALFGGCAAGIFPGPAGFPPAHEQPWALGPGQC